MNIIPYGRQNITENDLEAVTKALSSDYLTQGPYIEEFEEAFSKYVGSKYSVAVSNGTAALHLSTLALCLKEGQKVITSPITFAASANCIRYCNGEVVFCDIDPETYLIDLNKLKNLLDSSPKGTYSGIIPVDFAGRAVDLEELKKITDEYGLWIIEDACHAPGGYFIDRHQKIQRCGNGKFANLSIFSFHPVKHIACGEGGMITTNDEFLYNKLIKLRSHGISRIMSEFQNSIEFARGDGGTNELLYNQEYPGWYMEMQDLGFNYRLTDFQAALGLSQLKRADEGIKKRKEIALKYSKAFLNKKWLKSQSGYEDGHAYHLYVIEVENRLELYNCLKANKIFAQIHYIPVHLMPYYRKLGWNSGDMPSSESYYKGCISLPMYPTLTEKEQDFVINVINNFYRG